jgi:hypothetical protein
MKRSTQVSLVVMTATGIGAGAYALAPNDNCRQSPLSTTAHDPRDATTAGQPQGAMLPASAPDCRSPRGGSAGHGSSSFFSSSSWSGGPVSSGATTSAANGTSAATSVSRGGFGSIGHALGSFAGG